MNCEDRFSLLMALIIASVLSIITLTIGIADVMETKYYTENGYEQVVLPGRTSAVWQKSKGR
jgi:hypothetical protein